jgi:hypothetical protein
MISGSLVSGVVIVAGTAAAAIGSEMTGAVVMAEIAPLSLARPQGDKMDVDDADDPGGGDFILVLAGELGDVEMDNGVRFCKLCKLCKFCANLGNGSEIGLSVSR